MRTRNFIVSVFILFGCTQLFGQELRKEVCVGFRVGNGTLDTAYVDNTGRLAEIVSFLKDIQNDRTLELVEVEFCGSASPEGSILINRRLAGYGLDECNAAREAAKVRVPVLLIHGDRDTFVPSSMCEKIYQSCASPKKKLIVKGAAHAESYYKDTAAYEAALDDFIGGVIAG